MVCKAALYCTNQQPSYAYLVSSLCLAVFILCGEVLRILCRLLIVISPTWSSASSRSVSVCVCTCDCVCVCVHV